MPTLIKKLKATMITQDGQLQPKRFEEHRAIDLAISPRFIKSDELMSAVTLVKAKADDIPDLQFTEAAHVPDTVVHLLNGQHRCEILQNITMPLYEAYNKSLGDLGSTQRMEMRAKLNENGCWLAKIYDFGMCIIFYITAIATKTTADAIEEHEEKDLILTHISANTYDPHLDDSETDVLRNLLAMANRTGDLVKACETFKATCDSTFKTIYPMLSTPRILQTLTRLYGFNHFSENKELTAKLWATLRPTIAGLVMNYFDGLLMIFTFLLTPTSVVPLYDTTNSHANDKVMKEYGIWQSTQPDKFHIPTTVAKLVLDIVNKACITLLTSSAHDTFGLDQSDIWKQAFDQYIQDILREYKIQASNPDNFTGWTSTEMMIWKQVPNRLLYILQGGAWQNNADVMPPLGTCSPIICSAWVLEIIKMFNEVAVPIYWVCVV